MAQLGLAKAASSMQHSIADTCSLTPTNFHAPKAKRKLVAAATRALSPTDLEPSRKSRRIRGERVEPVKDSSSHETRALDSEGVPERGTFSLSLVNGRPKLGGPRAATYLHDVAGSFYLISIGVTVHDIGKVYRGPFAQRYWSRKGCLHHHPYPVGFRAHKYHFGRSFSMFIEAGLTGPIFRVQDDASGKFWEGDSPTFPWTEACLVSNSPGTRISGPLFFGFSDPITQKAISSMMNDEEKRASRSEIPHPSPNPSKEELISRELMKNIEGIGETAAISIATSANILTGGKKIKSSKDLRMLCQTAKGVSGLRAFLLEHTDMPLTVRRWPKWRKVIVPRMLESLASN